MTRNTLAAPLIASALLVIYLSHVASQRPEPAVRTRILDSLLGEGRYDSRVRPTGRNGSGPVQVDVDLFLISLTDVSEKSMDYTAQIFFRQRWTDSRLAYDDQQGKVQHLILNSAENMWRPDTFFSNEKSAHIHDVLLPNTFFRIYPTGALLYSMHISLQLSCPMDLKRFPFDTQVCNIFIVSYGHTTDDVIYQWKKIDPIEVPDSLHILNYRLVAFNTDYCTSRTNTGTYSCLKAKLVLQRETHTYAILVIIPCCMFVLLSWITFWLSNRTTLARVLVPLLVLIAMASMISRSNQDEFPKLSYSTALDTWTGVCMTFVFAVLIQVGIVDYIVRRNQNHDNVATQRLEEDKMSGVEPLEMDDSKRGDSKTTAGMPKNWKWQEKVQSWLNQTRSIPDFIDILSRILFPLAFAIFVIIYLSTFATQSIDIVD